MHLVRILLLFTSLVGGVLLAGVLVRAGAPWPVFLALMLVPLGVYSVIYRRQEGRWPDFGQFSSRDRELMRRYPAGQPPRRTR